MEGEPPAQAPPSSGSSLSSALRVVASVGIPTVLVVVIFAIALAPEEEDRECWSDVHFMLSSEDKGNGEWEVLVAGLSNTYSLTGLDLRVLKNGTVVATMMSGEPITGSMTFTDLNFDGRLTVGDYFTVQCDPGSTYELVVTSVISDCTLWKEKWET